MNGRPAQRSPDEQAALTPGGRDPANPFPWYRAMRERSPVSFDAQHGTWHVFRYADVQRVLSEYAAFSSRPAGSSGREGPDAAGAGSALANSLISTDPPRHRQLRTLVSQAFTPRAIEALAPRITAIVHCLLDRVAGAGEMDLIWDLAYPLPVIVIAELLGIPAEERDQFKRWTDAVVTGASAGGPPGGPLTGLQAQREMAEYFARTLAERRRQPQDDLISSLLAAQIEGQHLSVQEILGFCVLLLIAGNETTTNLIGNAVLTLDEHPDALAAVRADAERLPGAIEEVLRYRSPVQSMFRTVARETALGDGQARPGQRVVAWIGSANHDEAVFDAPERFEIGRTPNRHIAFGHGAHFCPGAPLARLEAQIALRALLERLPDLRRRPGEPLQVMDSIIVYGPRRLPVTFRAS